MSFKTSVIQIIKKIPAGRVTNYGTIATLAGAPRQSRAVGYILHSSSEEFDLPWQRVVNKKGFISIKSLEHPKQLQRQLLEEEGVEVSEEFVVDLDKYGWFPSSHSGAKRENL